MKDPETNGSASGNGRLELTEALVITWMPMLKRYCLALTGDGHDADDAVQETFMEAQRAIGRYDRQRDFGAWLRGIARNVVMRARRKLARQRRVEVSLDSEVLEQIEKLYEVEGYTNTDPLEALKACMERLSEENRHLILAEYREGMALKALAEQYGKTLSWVKTRTMRIRRLLADCVLRKLGTVEGDKSVAGLADH